MRRRVDAIVFLPVLLLFLTFSTRLYAQENGVKHPLTFAELTYGGGIQAVISDGAGGVWFGGSTCSETLPTTSNAIQKWWSGPACHPGGLLGRITGDGTITYLSYFGGSGPSAVAALARGPSGNLYVAGVTHSADFPTTAGAYDRTCGADGGCSHGDGFITELTPDGSTIVFSTYLGGADDDEVAAIAVDAAGRVNITGSTASADFPTTPAALRRTYAGGADTEGEPLTDAFFVRLTPDGSALQYGTFLGGSGGDSGYGVAVGPDGDTYVAGSTSSGDFPTVNPARPHSASAGSSAFLTRFSLSGPVYSTYVGDAAADAVAVAVIDNRVYIGGSGADPSGAANIGVEAYIAELDAGTGAGLRRIAFHGVGSAFRVGGAWAYGSALAVDQNHVAYFVGRFLACTSCGPDVGRYPTTWDAFRRAAPGTDAGDATLSIVDFRPARPAVLYSTMLGDGGTDLATAVAPDGAGGAFLGGQSEGFQPVNGQPPPPKDPGSNYQSFLAHVGVQPVTMPTSPADIVLYAYDASGTGFNPTAISGDWILQEDATAAGGWSVREGDEAAAKVTTPAVDPPNYFELEFLAEANVPYHLWMRMKADNDSYQNDSVWVQFSDSVDVGGNSLWRIGSTDATGVVLEDCSGCREQGWGWNDNGYGTAGTPVIFATSGWHTIRIQQREDGIAFDQIVLSSSQWASVAPGANKNDATILRQSYALPSPSGDLPPTVSITSPADNSTFDPETNITIAASAFDSDGTIASVDFYAGDTLLGRSTTAPYSITWRVHSGSYNVYAVAADNQGAVTTSSSISVLVTGPPQGPPTGLVSADVGDTGASGSANYSNGTFTVQGAGADVWGTADAFHFVYVPLSTSGWIVARMATVSDQANWVKAGVMIRGSLDPTSAQAFMLVSHAKGVAFQRRTADGGPSVSTAGSASTAPLWVKLVRDGQTISGYESTDGSHWTLVGTDTLAIRGFAFMGLAVSSHVSGTLATATFDSVTTSVPVGWTDSDIGSVPFPGSVSYKDENGTFIVTGSGADIWGSADAFHYAATTLIGDGTIVARVAAVQNANAWTKAGVMIRETEAAGSAHAFMLVSAGKGVAFQRRDVTDGTSVSTAGSASTAPHWVRLTRTGNTFKAYESSDGANWTLVGTDTIPMAHVVSVGLAVTSHNTAATATCTFDNVSIK